MPDLYDLAHVVAWGAHNLHYRRPQSFFCVHVTAEKRKTAHWRKFTALLHYRQTITAVLHYRRQNTAIFCLPLPPKSLPPKNKKRLPPTFTAVLHYRRKNTAIVWFTAPAKVVTVKNEKTANRLKITVVWKYRPAFVRLKTVTNDHPDILVSDLVPDAFVVWCMYDTWFIPGTTNNRGNRFHTWYIPCRKQKHKIKLNDRTYLRHFDVTPGCFFVACGWIADCFSFSARGWHVQLCDLSLYIHLYIPGTMYYIRGVGTCVYVPGRIRCWLLLLILMIFVFLTLLSTWWEHSGRPHLRNILLRKWVYTQLLLTIKYYIEYYLVLIYGI